MRLEELQRLVEQQRLVQREHPPAGTPAPTRTAPPRRAAPTRVGWEQSFGFTDNFDPTGEYLGNAWGILDNLLVRPLIGYKHAAGADGNELIGDLATAVPKPTDNGLTYTYKLRSGVKFGPPVNRVITSKDVAYALDRLADPKNGGQYGFYYSVIKGWDAAGKNGSHVSGIETPDNNTLVIHLTKPTGDFNRAHVDAGDRADPVRTSATASRASRAPTAAT